MAASEYPIFNVTANPKIIPVVLPPSADPSTSGKIRNIPVRGADHSGWLVYAGEQHGWVLKREKELDGFKLLEDLYRAEGNMEGWDAYKRYLKDWQAGRTRAPFPVHMLPKDVQAWQRGEVSPEHKDPWNLPAPSPTTGALAEPKAKKAEAKVA